MLKNNNNNNNRQTVKYQFLDISSFA